MVLERDLIRRTKGLMQRVEKLKVEERKFNRELNDMSRKLRTSKEYRSYAPSVQEMKRRTAGGRLSSREQLNKARLIIMKRGMTKAMKKPERKTLKTMKKYPKKIKGYKTRVMKRPRVGIPAYKPKRIRYRKVTM